MTDHICICRSCIDPRETDLKEQHGLPKKTRCYMPRQKGAFIPKPGTSDDISSSEAMLVDLGRKPVIFIQGHRDCAAVCVLYNAAERIWVNHGEANNATEREFLRSYGDVAKRVLETGAHLSRQQKLKVLEEICVLATINNCMEHESLNGDFRPVFYALFSETPANFDDVPAENIGLMIYDPAQGAFGRLPASRGNVGIRIIDFVNPDMSRRDDEDGFGITSPIDLEEAIRNAIRWTLAVEVPIIERTSEAVRGEGPSVPGAGAPRS